MSSKDKTLIAGLMESFVSDVPSNPFVSFCVFCNKGVIKEEMTYQKGYLFHKDCYEKHGSNYPQVNQEHLSQNNNDKVQLVQLKNLKIRMMGTSNPNRVKIKKKSKRKTKKRPTKRRVTKRKRIATKRKKTKKKTSRRNISKNRRIVKRKTASKRKTKRSASRTKRKTRKRR